WVGRSRHRHCADASSGSGRCCACHADAERYTDSDGNPGTVGSRNSCNTGTDD
ncbi:MAG: hypothetical protein ACI8XD_001342, partial [Thermoproteota archaeon]